MSKLFMRDTPNDGGAACLATILHHFGLFITPIDLAGDEPSARGEISAAELLEKAARFGLEGRVATLTVQQLDDRDTPFLAYVAGPEELDANRLVVVFRIRRDKVWLGDPDLGRQAMARSRFAAGYSGRAITFTPTARFTPGTRSRSYLAQFAAFLAVWRGRILLSLALGMVASAAGFALIYLTKYFVDVLIPAGTGHLALFLLVYFLARLLNICAGGFNLLYTVLLRNAVTRVLAGNHYRRILDLEIRHIDSREPGEFIDQFTRIETLTKGISDYFAHFLLALLGIGVKVALLVWLYDPVLVAILCAVLACNGLAGLLFSRRTGEMANRQGFVAGMINSLLLDSLADIRVVRLFAAREWVYQRFRRQYGESLDLVRRLARLEVWGQSLADLLNTLSEAAIFIICGIRILGGTYSIGDFLLFFTFAQGLAAESRQFPQLLLSFPVQLRSFARVQALLALSTERKGGAPPRAGGMEIVFDRVCFSYDKKRPVLDQVSFTLEPGKTTAFVGSSGSGKTTLMSLIMGFYPPDSGRILVNGQDLATLDLEAHRRAIATVFQDTGLLTKTLFQNIALGDKHLDVAQIHATARALGIDRLIDKLPMGYELLLYQGMLSGGETQLVGILRALCKPFELLIMDEATSHLDSETEARVLAGMRALGVQGKTRAIIAHRLNTVRSADRIVVMAAGKVAEIGTHEELVRRRGSYMDLVQRQYEVNLTPEG